MKIKDIKEEGFYECVPFNPEYHEIYEIYYNEDSEDPEMSGLFLDVWIYDYTGEDGRKRYETYGMVLNPENSSYADLEVTKTKEKWYMPKLDLNAGHLLIEDKLTYKEKLEKVYRLCNKASKCTQFVGGVEVKEAQKLAIKILKIIN